MHGGAAMGHAGAVAVHPAPVARVGAASAPHMVARAQARSVRQARAGAAGQARIGGVRNGRRANNFNNNFNNGFNNDFGEPNFNDVPGLGFDYPHLAAISGGNRRFGRGFFGAPFFDSGFLFGSPSVIIEQPAPAEAQPEADDAVAGNGAGDDPAPRSRRAYGAEASRAPAESQPEQQIEQYVFVKRDGGLEFAVAYSWVDGSLRYITPDGRRRTLGRDALDLNATEQFNGQRGVEFHAPA